MNAFRDPPRDRILVVGRSPSVLHETVGILRSKGYTADATNQFDHVLDDYDPATIDVVVLGGMVPGETKRDLREQFAARNPDVTFVQGLAASPGLIAAQAEGAVWADQAVGNDVAYDTSGRLVRLTLESDLARRRRGVVGDVPHAAGAHEHLDATARWRVARGFSHRACAPGGSDRGLVPHRGCRLCRPRIHCRRHAAKRHADGSSRRGSGRPRPRRLPPLSHRSAR